MRPHFGLLLALTVVFLLPAAADEEVVIFRSDVSLVRVDAQVLGRDNRAITGLRAEDFVLREDGKPQEIRNFANESMPVDVLLLLDVSGSMRPHVQSLSSAAQYALQVLGKEDRVAIMVFDRASRLRAPFSNSRSAVARGLESLLDQETFDGGTDVTRGLLDAADYVARNGRRDARRAIVVLTDDQTERNRDEEAVSRALTRADAVLSLLLAPNAMRNRQQFPGGGGGSWPGGSNGGPLGGIILGRRPQRPVVSGTSRTQSAGTAEIARRSGGDNMSVDDASALETTLARIRQRYALHFYLPQGVQPGEERGIEVTLSDAARRRYSDAEVRYRRVYLAPGEATPALTSQAPDSQTRDGQARESQTREPAPADERPRLKRRPAVSENGPRNGPLDTTSADNGPTNTATRPEERPVEQDSTQGGWRRVDEKPDGWREVKPGQKP